MGKRIRLEPEVKTFALELNNEYKRMRNLIAARPKRLLAFIAAVIADKWAKEANDTT